MGEAIDGCTAFNLALCVAIAWGVPEYLSADCFAKFAFFYPIYASLCAVGGNGCVKNWSCYWVVYASFNFFSAWFAQITIPHFELIQHSFLVYCMHPKFNGASQFSAQFLGPVIALVQKHLWAVLLAIDHFYGGYWGDGFYCKFTFYFAVYNTLKGSNANWLLFWVLYHVTKEYNDQIEANVPYWACAKKVFLVWCWHECFNGATVVYDFAIKPWFPVVEATVNKIVAPIMNAVHNAADAGKKNE